MLTGPQRHKLWHMSLSLAKYPGGLSVSTQAPLIQQGLQYTTRFLFFFSFTINRRFSVLVGRRGN